MNGSGDGTQETKDETPINQSVNRIMEKLPNELILEVVLYLPVFEILPMSLVNKKFYEVCSDNVIWKSMTLSLFADGEHSSEEIKRFETETSINWKLLYFLCTPLRFDCFDSMRKGERMRLSFDQTRVEMSRDMNKFPTHYNYSVQTGNHFIAKNKHFYVWEFKVINHTCDNLAIGISDEYFALVKNFVGYAGMKANMKEDAPSFSCSSDGIIRNGIEHEDEPALDTYGSGDRITVIVDCMDDEASNCYCRFFKNGKELGIVKCKGMHSDRKYWFTVTFYSELDVGCIVTPRNLKLKIPLEGINNNSNRNDCVSNDCSHEKSYVYSISILEILPLYKKFIKMQTQERMISTSLGWFKRFFKNLRI